MKKTIVLLLLLLAEFGFTSFAQVYNPWIIQPGYVCYMWPSFVSMHNGTKTIDFTNYSFQVSNPAPGEIHFTDDTATKSEALTAALMLVGGDYEISKYGIAKDKPNVIPYKGGAIVYGYWKEKNRWELFNSQGDSLFAHKAYRLFKIVKKAS